MHNWLSRLERSSFLFRLSEVGEEILDLCDVTTGKDDKGFAGDEMKQALLHATSSKRRGNNQCGILPELISQFNKRRLTQQQSHFY